MEESRFPNKLKLFRCCSGYSQKKVARMLGHADASTLSRWEHGVALPGIMQLFRLARMYGTQPHELFDELWQQINASDRLLTPQESFTTNQSFSL